MNLVTTAQESAVRVTSNRSGQVLIALFSHVDPTDLRGAEPINYVDLLPEEATEVIAALVANGTKLPSKLPEYPHRSALKQALSRTRLGSKARHLLDEAYSELEKYLANPGEDVQNYHLSVARSNCEMVLMSTSDYNVVHATVLAIEELDSVLSRGLAT